jgi:hypothetical protein
MDVGVVAVSTGIDSKNPEVQLTGPQLARQLGLDQSQLWLWIRHGIVPLAPEPEFAESQTQNQANPSLFAPTVVQTVLSIFL